MMLFRQATYCYILVSVAVLFVEVQSFGAFRPFNGKGHTFQAARDLVRKKDTKLHVGAGYANMLKRRNVQISLLEITDSEAADSSIIPLPSAHLPDELSTLQIYGIELTAGIHKMMISDVLSKFRGKHEEPMYGHICHRPDPDSLVGAIGCAAEIVIATPSDAFQVETIEETSVPYSDFDDESPDAGNNSGETPMMVLAKGSFRFVVKEVIQTFPYPTAIVDELLDDAPVEDEGIQQLDLDYDDDDDDDDDEEDYDMYAMIPSVDLIPRTMAAMKAIVDQQLATKPKTISPLEQSILEESGVSSDIAMRQADAKRNQVEEMAANFDVFVSSLLDIAPTRSERLYAVAIMAAEFAGLENDTRRKILSSVDGVGRLRVVLAAAEKRISMVQAKKLTEEITNDTDEGSKDLLVGEPTLPPWAKNLKKGTSVDYFWSEVDGWCTGEVTEDPVMIVDELIVTVLFDDGETHRLPFRGDEKVRWRPGGMS